MLNLHDFLANFRFPSPLGNQSKATIIEALILSNIPVSRYINEFWTAGQRKASSLHEISYRACFKPQLPRFFIELLTTSHDTVYDPFSGRGTTGIEAGLLNRQVILNDVNPLSMILAKPRFFIPAYDKVAERLQKIPINLDLDADIPLSMFFHKKTEAEIVSFKNYLHERANNGIEDELDQWIRMVATNRLTGHSPGFFSVYALPPNQAISPEGQIKINQKRNQIPEYRNVREIILKKTKNLINRITSADQQQLRTIGEKALFLTCNAQATPAIPDETISLTVTSPPFLDIVQYSKDNWLRCWFNSLDDKRIVSQITMAKTIDEWSTIMKTVFYELYRITKPLGWVAFEVGEVRKGKIRLDDYVVPLGKEVGFHCEGIVVNQQQFTKTSNIWGINNNHAGTNTNRIVVFKKS